MQYIGNGTFAPHGGIDTRTVQFPSTFYVNGALNLDYVAAYETIAELSMRWSLSINRDLVGPPPPTDLFAAAIDYASSKPSVFKDYKFDRTATYLWDIESPMPPVVGGTALPLTTDTNAVSAPPSVAPTQLRSNPPTVSPTLASIFPTKAPTFSPHSGNLLEVAAVSTEDAQHLTSFHDENDDWESSVLHSKDDTFYSADTGDVSLANYFSRPLLIYSGDWVTKANTVFSLDPWSLYFDNPRVSNRISNYRNLRCNMHIKILVNGTPFDYGRGLLHYVPLVQQDIYASTDPRFGISDLVANSQRPHLYIDPCTSQGGTMILPYFYYNNSLLIPSREWANMGKIYFSTIVPLANCNGSTDPVTITVFAWAEDVVLSCPTAMEPTALVPQMGKDEYGEGIVNRPAMVTKHISGALRVAKSIEKYATAAVTAAGYAGDVAKMMGMSRPNIVTDTIYVKRDDAAHLANVDRPDPIQKLSYDSKQAVTIDPRVVGLAGEDEMHIAAIASRESFLTTFPWARVSAPGTKLFEIGITPSVWNAGLAPISGGRLALQLPACAAMALPFAYWRGSMKYRFQIVKSSFHRGRIRIVYEPGTTQGTTCEYNTNMSEIIDIGDNTDFCIVVGWHSNKQYLATVAPGSVPASNLYKTTAGFPSGITPIVASVDLPGIANGSLSVYVVNTLEAPAAAATVTNDIQVIVSVSACEDFEVFQPVDILDHYTFSAQMGAERVLSDPERASPLDPPILATFGKCIQPDGASLIYYGDPVISIRAVLKRYMLADTFIPKTTTPNVAILSDWKMNMSAFPQTKGLHPFGRHLLAGKAVNIVNVTHLNYYSVMFQARRGGIRNKFICQGDASGLPTKVITRTTKAPYSNTVVAAGTALADLSLFSKLRLNAKLSGFSGTALNISNDLFEAEVPYSSTYRFLPARTRKIDDENDYPIVLESQLTTGTVAPNVILDRYVAAADDFSLLWFTGCPTIIWLPDPSVVS